MKTFAPIAIAALLATGVFAMDTDTARDDDIVIDDVVDSGLAVDSAAELPATGPKLSAAADRFLGRCAELFLKMETLDSSHFETLKPEDERRVLRAMTAALWHDADVTAPDSPATTDSDHTPSVHSLVAANGIFQLRIDHFDETVVASVDAALATADTARDKGTPMSLIVDLRRADGDNYRAALALASKLAPKKTKPNARAFRLALLIGPETREAAEVFAAVAGRSGAIVSVGRPTAGKPWIPCVDPLASGDFLVTPSLPNDVRSGLITPVKPDIAAPADGADDVAARKAEDILTGLSKLKRLDE